MSKHRLSLIDILNPPANPWLKAISQGNVNLPAGVRVVRLCDDDSGGSPSASLSGPSPGTPAPMKQAA